MNVFANDKLLFSILNGQSKSVTIAKLRTLSITTDSIHGTKGKFYLVINKKMAYVDREIKNFTRMKQVECFFTDQCGNRTNPCFNEVITCEVISGRTNQKIMLPSGKTVLLQKVKLRKNGYVCLEYEDNCYIGPIPLFIDESFLLYAPDGTTISCEIEKAFCHATFSPSDHEDVYYMINLTIKLQQNVKVLGHANVLVEGNVVHPCKR